MVISAWHRMSYDTDGRPYMTRELERHVRLLHRLVGNAAAEGKNIVFGAGSTHLLNAALHALAIENSSSPSAVVATVPYYPVSFFPFIAGSSLLKLNILFLFLGSSVFFFFLTGIQDPNPVLEIQGLRMERGTGHAGSRFGYSRENLALIIITMIIHPI